jgi:hypothetical protein
MGLFRIKICPTPLQKMRIVGCVPDTALHRLLRRQLCLGDENQCPIRKLYLIDCKRLMGCYKELFKGLFFNSSSSAKHDLQIWNHEY